MSPDFLYDLMIREVVSVNTIYSAATLCADAVQHRRSKKHTGLSPTQYLKCGGDFLETENGIL